MEKGLRECCRSIRIGKILIQSNDETRKASVIYSKFPNDINIRKILVMYPIISKRDRKLEILVSENTKFYVSLNFIASGLTVILAIKVLKDHGVSENNIILLCLFATPSGKSELKLAVFIFC